MRPSRVPALIIVLLVLPASAWAQDTIYGCVKNNNGQLRIVTAGGMCLPSEHEVQWTLGGGSTPPAPTAAKGPLQVVDQNGTPLGLFQFGSPSYAIRQIGDLWVGLPLTATGFQVTDLFSFMPYYQDFDAATSACLGDAYMPADVLRTGVVMSGAGGQLTLSYAGTPEVDRTSIHAYARWNGSAWKCYAFTPGTWMPLFGKVASVDVSTFQAPFKIVQ